MITDLSLDSVAFLRTLVIEMNLDVDHAYTEYGGYTAEDGHVALQRICSKLETLTAFLDAISPVEPKDDK